MKSQIIAQRNNTTQKDAPDEQLPNTEKCFSHASLFSANSLTEGQSQLGLLDPGTVTSAIR